MKGLNSFRRVQVGLGSRSEPEHHEGCGKD
jgi:hypothetical protein